MSAAPVMIEIATPAIDTLQDRIDPIVVRADAMTIEDQETYQAAASFLTGCKAMEKEIRETLEPTIRKAHEAHKAVTALRAKLLAPIERAELTIKRKIADYSDRVAEEARRERQRQEAEARRIEEERLLRAAQEAAARGDEDAAEEILEAPIVLPAARVVEAPKAEGVAIRKRYSARVVDTKALLRAAAAGTIPDGLVLPNQKALDALARSIGESFAMPGVELVVESTVAAKAS